MAGWREAMAKLFEEGKTPIIVTDDADLGAISFTGTGFTVEGEYCSTSTGGQPVHTRTPEGVDAVLKEFGIPNTGWW
jgi:hypothetical protein